LQTQKKKGGCKDEKNKHAKTIDNKHKDIEKKDANLQTKKTKGEFKDKKMTDIETQIGKT
jgi:hypothetical protein